ncbi:hypothetical protein BDR04DRAFT_1108914 [Suillus decipiens]|nr:hypothetical protein BDR04DRAFT_1108914 [Suillus decipiens]
MFILIVLPWICTRHIKVDIVLPSPKVAVVLFERGMQRGLLARINRLAVKLSVSFRKSSVSSPCDTTNFCNEGTRAKYHYLICGVQGDSLRAWSTTCREISGLVDT